MTSNTSLEALALSGEAASTSSLTTESIQGESAQVRAQLQLRELILSGELAGGERIIELSIVERLKVSRTPVRAALMRLEQEGLLQALPHGGYIVKTFTERDIAESIEMRGTLEGLVARLAAERSAPAVVIGEARQCLRKIDELLLYSTLSNEALASYVELNEQFHKLLCEMAGSEVITKQLERVMSLPFASPSSFVIEQAESKQARDMLVVAQDQHWQVLQAIEGREGSRAESVMREHSRIAQRNLRQAVGNYGTERASAVAGLQLIRKRN